MVTGSEQARPLEVLVELLVELLVRADAELVDCELGVRGRGRVDSVDHRVDLVDGLVRVAPDVELDDRGVPVGRNPAGVFLRVRALDVGNHVDGRDAPLDVGDSRPERGAVGGERPALDEHGLACGLLEAGVEDPGGPAGLARERVVVAELLRAHGSADHDHRDHEREPAEDRRLAVTCAPAAHPGGDVAAALQGCHHGLS